jgi:hypothetical protein
MGVSGQRHAPAALYPLVKDPGYPLDWIGGWVGLRAGMDAGARIKILCLCRGSNPDRPARSQTLYCLSYPGSFLLFLAKGLSKWHNNLWYNSRWSCLLNNSLVLPVIRLRLIVHMQPTLAISWKHFLWRSLLQEQVRNIAAATQYCQFKLRKYKCK